MNPLQYLTDLTILLIIGLFCGIISRKLKIPNMLLLIIAGIILSRIKFEGTPFFDFSHGFLISISVLTLVMIVFDGSSRFKLKEIDTLSRYALRMVLIFIVLNMLFLTLATMFLFKIQNVILCLIFVSIMSGTDPGSVLSIFKTSTNRVIELLKIESVINTPLMVLIPFILLDLMKLHVDVLATFIDQINPFLQQIITGVGTGVVIGLIVFRAMKKFYSESLSPLTLVTATLLTYILAETLGGNGVLAVSILGIFFGNFYVKEKSVLQEFSSMLANSLEILVFILVGFIVPITVSWEFLFKSILLFIIMIVLRYISLTLAFFSDHINFKEKMFMTLNCAKGIAVAVVAFILSKETITQYVISGGTKQIADVNLTEIPGTSAILKLMVLFIIYSIILSSLSIRFSHFFIRKKVKQE
ncbi:hypothetical protein GF327_08200 [Candidatus Woesearchaeota archaeon]|nr:hypothetical protein [Candidatus Woesearchaeota archaeon]